jgi:hypothetical protein
MATVALPQSLIAKAKTQTKREFVTPSYALRNTPAPADLPKDELGREVALLLWYHPEIAKQVGDVNIRAMSADAKRALLMTARELLGIKPLRRRRLGYVGP